MQANVRLITSGSLLLAAALLSMTTVLLPANSEAPAPPSEAILTQQLQPNALGVGERQPSPIQNIKLTFSYPPRLRENETGVVSLTYERFVDTKKSYSETSPLVRTTVAVLDADTTAQVSSSGFKIAPDGTVKREKGARFPIVFKWTITPEHEGDHAIILDVSQLLLFASPKRGDRLTTDFVKNGSLVPLEDDGLVDLPVAVRTPWGVTQVEANIASGILAVGAFAVSYPIFIEWLKRLLSMQDKDRDAPAQPGKKKSVQARRR